jgi:hypothetical protein
VLSAVALSALAAPSAPRADDDAGGEEPPARVERPNALRAGGYVQTGGLFRGPLWDASYVLTYSRQLAAPLAVELSGGPGSGGGRRGPHLGAGLRLSLTPHGTSAVTLGIGSRLALLDTYGPVAFGQAELAWELRTRFGLTALVGGGWGMTFTTSRADPSCTSRGGWWGCDVDRFHSGDSGLWLHGELGWAF